MADYKTRLTADTSQHDQALKKSAQQVYQYKKKTEEAKVTLGKLAGKFGPLAAQIGIAGGALGTFKKMLTSTEQGSDALDRTLHTAKTTVERFFQSISSGSFNAFTDGLHEITKAAREAYNALDDLGTMKMWNNADIEKQRTIIAKNKTIIYDRNATAEQKMAAQQAIDNAIKEIERLNGELVKQSNKASNALLREYAGTTRVTTATLEKYRKMLKEGTLSQYAADFKKKNSYETYDYVTMDANAPASKMYYTKWNDKNAETLYNVMQSYLTLPEDKWQALLDIETQNEQRMQQIEQMKQQAERTAGRLESGNSSTAKIKVEFEKGSIADIEKQIQDLQSRLRNEVLNGAEINAINKQIEALTAKKEALESLGKPIEKLKRLEAPLEEPVILQLDNSQCLEALQETIDKIKETGTTWDDLERLEGMGDVFDGIGDSISNLGACFDEQTQNIFSGLGQIVSGIGSVLPRIAALIAAEEGEAMASGLAGAAKVEPYPAKVAAIVAIVAQILGVIGSIASIAKFADGGIIGGATSIGDYNIARVNAGEMILNNRQQQKLFNMLNNPTISTTSTDNGNVTFTIHGSDLQGTLSNYNKRINRVK